jgi:IS1 family transposase
VVGYEAGAFCLEYQDAAFRELSCRRLQVDEMWSFVYRKAKNVTPSIAAKNQAAGDAWWVAIDADTKLVPCWSIGPRDAVTAHDFIEDLAKHIGTSCIERQNLSVRMTNRRFTRLTNAFSKKIENHMAAVELGSSRTTSSRFTVHCG